MRAWLLLRSVLRLVGLLLRDGVCAGTAVWHGSVAADRLLAGAVVVDLPPALADSATAARAAMSASTVPGCRPVSC